MSIRKTIVSGSYFHVLTIIWLLKKLHILKKKSNQIYQRILVPLLFLQMLLAEYGL